MQHTLTKMSMPLTRLILASIFFASIVTSARAWAFEQDGWGYTHGVIAISAEATPFDDIDASMAKALAGILCTLDGPAMKELETGLDDVDQAAPVSDAVPAFYLRLVGPQGEACIAAYPDDSGTHYLLQHDGQPIFSKSMASTALRRQTLDRLLVEAPAYRGAFELDDSIPELPYAARLKEPYVQSSVVLDEATQRARIFGEKESHIRALDYVLAKEQMHIRLPAGYHPRRPAGLLVWCSPNSRGNVPQVFHKALDELGVIGVGVRNAGNERPFVQRAQLMFDAAATVMARYHVDPRRVYITGMSGGGRVSSVLAMCFPDVFAGAVPIVGFASYNRLRSNSVAFSKPKGEMLKAARSMRMAMMSGPLDFLYPEMVERKRRLELDGFRGIRMFEYPEMAHEMPKLGHFVEALTWVDEPYRDKRAAEVKKAAHLLETYLQGREHVTPQSEENRAALVEIVRAGPWTEAAWEALALLVNDDVQRDE